MLLHITRFHELSLVFDSKHGAGSTAAVGPLQRPHALLLAAGLLVVVPLAVERLRV